ncbi:hypothetical protein BC6307_20280 [Sutcliffiella cohnii]|uniref:Uncharacterized protein n=1 Tax=Sutcliffiella cohnii TaxID=33932 RepID=A0A223KVE0_9BACI|nr:hypothetical protein [Sutcliffiella cohnii]AST93435.1 hypothetical protein BC6307_20280 [Sutcliffiella cohnii]
MDALTWKIISIVGYSLSGIFFIIAIFMFFKLNVLAIIGDLTGRTAAKQIQAIREQNSNTGQKRYKPDAFNVERGKLTDAIINRSKRLRKTGNMDETESSLSVKTVRTEEVSTPRVLQSGHLVQRPQPLLEVLSEETEVLIEETEVLALDEVAATETTLLSDETELLQEDATTILNPTEELTREDEDKDKKFTIVKDIKIVHSKEEI